MKNKAEKAQETIIKRGYEKPVLLIISTKESRGKQASPAEFTYPYGAYGGS
jgi:hypothetical protein